MGSITNCRSTALSLLLCAILSQTITAQNSPKHFLNPHNAARADAGVDRILWNYTLAAYAEDYANRRVDDCRLLHSGGPYGEDLFWGVGADFTAADAVAVWVSEEYYDYDSNSCSVGEECGHYTQVVWAGVSLECASVTCSGARGVFITCSYDPPGNVVGGGLIH